MNTKNLFIGISYAFLITACSPNNGGGIGSSGQGPAQKPNSTPPKISATEVNLNQKMPGGYSSTYNPNLYINRNNNSDNNNYSLFFLNGTTNQNRSPYKFNTPIPFSPHLYVTDFVNKNIVFTYSTTLIETNNPYDEEAWLAKDLALNTDGIINAKWLAAKFSNMEHRDLQVRFHKAGKYAVGAFNERINNKINSDLIFSEFLPLNNQPEPSITTNSFESACASEPEDMISAINTATINNKNYVAVGSRRGAICIYEFESDIKNNWFKLTNLAELSGQYNRDKKFITSVQLHSDKNNTLYGYWTYIKQEVGHSDVNILKAKINLITKEVKFTSLFDKTKFRNVPNLARLDDRNLFVDLNNNVYIGSSDIFTGSQKQNQLPARVYVLLANSNEWQGISLLPQDPTAPISGHVVSISLAADGVTPIVGVKNGLRDPRIVDKAYYLNIKAK